MQPLIVDLPPELREFVESSVIRSTWKEPADFVRHLIEKAHDHWVEAVEQMADEAVQSGPATAWNSADLEEMRLRLRERHGAKEALGEP